MTSPPRFPLRSMPLLLGFLLAGASLSLPATPPPSVEPPSSPGEQPPPADPPLQCQAGFRLRAASSTLFLIGTFGEDPEALRVSNHGRDLPREQVQALNPFLLAVEVPDPEAYLLEVTGQGQAFTFTAEQEEPAVESIMDLWRSGEDPDQAAFNDRLERAFPGTRAATLAAQALGAPGPASASAGPSPFTPPEEAKAPESPLEPNRTPPPPPRPALRRLIPTPAESGEACAECPFTLPMPAWATLDAWNPPLWAAGRSLLDSPGKRP